MLKRLLLAVLLSFAAIGARAADYTDIWWNPAENGWGVNLVQSDNFIFATFFVYGPNNQPIWYAGNLNADGLGNYTGGLYLSTGTYFGTVPYNLAQWSVTQVGTATFTPSTAYTGVLTYSVGGVTVTKNIQRQTLTAIALGGSYVGGQSGEYVSCPDTSLNATYIDTYTTLSVSQSPASVATFTFNYDLANAMCTMSGTLEQHGQLYTIPNATYQCTGGLNFNETATMYEIKATAQGIEGRFTSNLSDGCTENAWFSAVLR
jgi:hypothetical protein